MRFGWARCKHFFCCCCFARYNRRFRMRIQTFGKLPYGQTVQLYEIENKHGVVLSVINYGARIVGLKVPSLHGEMVDVVCGFKTLEDYLKDDLYFGAIVGRVAGRTFPTTITIDGKAHNLTGNTGEANSVHLHGGLNGFDQALWKAEVLEESNGVAGVKMRYVSPAGTEGYPGELVVEVEYRLTNDNEVMTHITAFAEEPTLASLPNHAYFNLGGKDDPTIYDHYVTIDADSYLPVQDCLPTGEILPVMNTVYDFRKPTRLGDVIPRTPEDGFDDYWCSTVTAVPTRDPRHLVKVYHPRTGINMDIYTTQPGVLMYTGNYLRKNVIGKYNEILDRHGAICFETQHYPNAINTPSFPSPVLRAGETYDHTTVWKFSQVKHKEQTIPETPKLK